MDVRGSKIGIVGGSIAGCAAAIALQRLGCNVTILERSSNGLSDRGSGIAIPIPLRDDLIASGYLPSDYPTFRLAGRRWFVQDGSDRGELLWSQPGDGLTNNWGVLWRGLRDRIGAAEYREGAGVVGLSEREDSVEVQVATGESDQFDLVVGADGYRSRTRAMLSPESAITYAGYVLWRGNFPEGRLEDRRAFDDILESNEWVTVGFEGGHAVMYPIPDFEGEGGGLRVNWAIYAPTPTGLTITEPNSIPPGAVTPNLYAQFGTLIDHAIPPYLRPLFETPREDVSIQPIFDVTAERYVSRRLMLIGDAATVSRPHTGSGATKAMQDALALERLGAEHTTWPDLLAAYEADRAPAGAALVGLGRRIGRDQVDKTPPWSSMSPEDFEQWTRGTLSGESLYFWEKADSAV